MIEVTEEEELLVALGGLRGRRKGRRRSDAINRGVVVGELALGLGLSLIILLLILALPTSFVSSASLFFSSSKSGFVIPSFSSLS